MDNHSAPFWAHLPFFGRKQQQHQSTGWQRYLHQREQPEYTPEPEAWINMQLRRINEARAQQVQPAQHTGAITPIPRTPNTEGMRKLPPRIPPGDNREWADVDTVKKLPLSHLLDVPLPGNALPVQRQATGAIDCLETIRADRKQQGQAEDPFGFAELPTWLAPATIDRMVEQALPPKQTGQAPEDAWLLDPPVLAPLSEQSLAVADKMASPIPPTSAFDELMRRNSSTLELPSVTKQIAQRHQKESE